MENLQPLQAMPAQFRQHLAPAAAPTAGPNEQQLLRDSHSFSFRVKSAVIGQLNRIDDHSPRLWHQVVRLVNLASPTHDHAQPGNMGQVVPGILRGEQPGESGMRYLASQGVKTVVNLTEGENRDAGPATALGMRSIHIPEHPWDAPTMDQARDFLRAVTNPANQPVYFHCYHGSDRTGTMAAVYRIAVQGWTADQAIGELEHYGFNTSFELAKLQFIHEFADQWRGRAAEFLTTGTP